MLARITRSLAHSQEIYHFGSAISNPPGERTACPAVTCRKVGKGAVMWIAVPLFDASTERQRKVFAHLMRSMLPQRTLVETDAPSWMEIMLRRNGTRTYITLYKAMSTYYDTPAFDVCLSALLPGASGRLTDVLKGTETAYSVRDGRVCWTARDFTDFAQFIWEEKA